MLKVGDMEEFSHAPDFKSLDPFFRVSRPGPCSTAVEEDGGDKILVHLQLLAKLMVLPSDPI